VLLGTKVNGLRSSMKKRFLMEYYLNSNSQKLNCVYREKPIGAESNLTNVNRGILGIQTATESLQRSSHRMSGSICYDVENTRHFKLH
jgi:hypothetical protein